MTRSAEKSLPLVNDIVADVDEPLSLAPATVDRIDSDDEDDGGDDDGEEDALAVYPKFFY